MIGAGDRVTVVSVPAGLRDHRAMETRTLFVCGTSDRTYVGAKYTTPKDQAGKGNIAELAKGFAPKMAHARFVGVPNVGHVPHLEAPPMFTSPVLDFLR